MTDTANFEGKVALVTGGSSGIGAAIAKALAASGARVVIAARRAAEGAAAASKMGPNVTFRAADVGDPASCEQLFQDIASTYGGLDFAVNNAGLGSAGKLLAQEDEAIFTKVVAINLTSVFRCMKHEIPSMLARGGGAMRTSSRTYIRMNRSSHRTELLLNPCRNIRSLGATQAFFPDPALAALSSVSRRAAQLTPALTHPRPKEYRILINGSSFRQCL